MALISILTPYRNAEKYIRETASSVLMQTHSDWEWILVNDHSEENEFEAIADFVQDPRIQVFQNNGKGIVDALCTAFTHAKGTYITRMDADDVMPDFKLAAMLHALENEHIHIVTGKVSYFSPDASISPGYLAYEKWLNERVDRQDFYDQIYRECSVASGNWMMRKTDLDRCGGFTGLNYPEDYDLLFRWYESGFMMKGLDLVTHLWRDHELRTSKTSVNYQQEAFFLLKVKRFIELDLDSTHQLFVNGTGQKGRLTAKVLIENRIPFVWVSHEPGKYAKGIFGHPLVGVNEIPRCGRAHILNTTLIGEVKLKEYYQPLMGSIRFYHL